MKCFPLRLLQVNMESLQDHDKVLRLVEKYCNLRSPPVAYFQGPEEPERSSAPSPCKPLVNKTLILRIPSLDIESDSLDRSGSAKKGQKRSPEAAEQLQQLFTKNKPSQMFPAVVCFLLEQVAPMYDCVSIVTWF